VTARDAAEQALAGLRPSLSADGFDLRVGKLTEGRTKEGSPTAASTHAGVCT
jgi:hypothetical protein